MNESIIRQVVNETRKKIQKRLDELDALWKADPLGELVELRKKVAEKLNSEGHFTEEGLKILQEAARKEKKLLTLSKKQHKAMLTSGEEEVKLKMQLGDLSFLEFQLSLRGK
ncbi:hypothetical protein [Desulforegula conservatrix]|uniref:hypothetical protein n=1 Tax=Desulforegula conservatrix TaxID=153026 RepID=UPI0003FA5B69|nr:hypothetical protein [Desulforegula conservatrix]